MVSGLADAARAPEMTLIHYYSLCRARISLPFIKLSQNCHVAVTDRRYVATV